MLNSKNSKKKTKNKVLIKNLFQFFCKLIDNFAKKKKKKNGTQYEH